MHVYMGQVAPDDAEDWTVYVAQNESVRTYTYIYIYIHLLTHSPRAPSPTLQS